MARTDELRRLRRSVRRQRLFSGLLLAWGAFWVYLFVDPPLQPELYQGKPIILASGVIFLLVGLAGLVLPRRWERRLLWILEHVQPEPARMRLRIETWSDSTDYRAEVQIDGQTPAWQVELASPGWDLRRLEGTDTAVSAYCDPRNRTPLVLEVGDRLLFATGVPQPA